MEIKTNRTDKQLTIALSGKLDALTAHELAETLKGIPADVEKLVFDMKQLEYVSSAGLRVLLAAYKQMGEGNMVVNNVNEMVGEVFSITGFSNVITIE